MKNRSTSLVLASAVALAAVAALPVRAEGLYVGGNLGTSHYDDPVNGIQGSGSGLSGKLYGGYQFTPNFSLEAGAVDLGHIDDATGHVKGHGAFVDAVGTLPIVQDWALIGRVGVAHLNLDTSQGDDSGSAIKVGAGAQYSLSPSTALRAEWERYRADAFGGKSNIDQYTVGVRYAF